MDKQMQHMPAYTNILYYLIVVFVLVGLIWAYFLPVELSVPGQGYVTYLGEPYAVAAPADGTVKSIESANAVDVQKGDTILTAQDTQVASGKQDQQDRENHIRVTAPSPGVLLWQRELIKGDRIFAGERLALIYPASPLGIQILLPEKDLGRVQPGMPVRVQLPAYPAQTFGMIEGVVQERVLQYDPRSGREMEVAVLVAFETIPDSRIQLSPGLSASVDILTGKTSLLKKLLF